jgi:purine-nucleoside phosphorylase
MADPLNETKEFLLKKGVIHPEIGIVLGTGLHQLASEINVEVEVSYSEIPHFQHSTVESHTGKLYYGILAGKQVLAMQGRFHFYEGYNFKQVTYPVRMMNSLGIKTILLSNAAGSLNPAWKKGELMLLNDHINLLPGNPLIGKNDDAIGPRFPDLSEAYSMELNSRLLLLAKKNEIILHEGIYAAVPGPMLETRAEYRYLRKIGADAVGMSTVPEVISAKHMGMNCIAISVLTDECDPDDLKPVEISEIIAVAKSADEKLTKLYLSLIATL